MISKRIIPCLDCDLGYEKGRVVKGVEFENLEEAGKPEKLAKKYYDQGADEIVFLDITASKQKRETMTEIVGNTSEKVFVPMTVGGGINSIDDARKIFNSGGDKTSINTSAIKNPSIIENISKSFGKQATVVAIDAKRRILGKREEKEDKEIINTPEGNAWYECSIYGGSKFTGIDAVKWAKEAEKRGAGEILLTSMDMDGQTNGYDIPLTKKISNEVSIPVIASGGCGNPEHIYEVFEKTKASAALAASIFHYNEYSVKDVKKYLDKKGIPVRL